MSVSAPLGSRMDGATHPPLLPIPGGAAHHHLLTHHLTHPSSLQLTHPSSLHLTHPSSLHLTRCSQQSGRLDWVSPVSPSGS